MTPAANSLFKKLHINITEVKQKSHNTVSLQIDGCFIEKNIDKVSLVGCCDAAFVWCG